VNYAGETGNMFLSFLQWGFLNYLGILGRPSKRCLGTISLFPYEWKGLKNAPLEVKPSGW